ncbi:MAG: cardiolipin synthase [Oscillospiraceae bacterium]|nr:cardiolipin synthase [Oscillospiraceae bacterium]
MENNNEKILSLIDKGKKGLLGLLFSRLGLVVLLLACKVLIILAMMIYFRDYSPYYMIISSTLAILVAVYIINNNYIDPTSKITWLVVISALPLFGTIFFCYTRSDIGFRALKYAFSKSVSDTENILVQQHDVFENLQKESIATANLANYIQRSGHHPVYNDCETKYFSSGEEKFQQMLIELEKAEKFIMLEYFIIDEGVMWGRILEILARKAKQGVDVMVMYDGSNEFTTLPRDYSRRLDKLGIKCRVFAPATPFVSTHYNYRDHRKILVIDNAVAFTGGVNLADEYINQKEKYGRWKDSAIMVKGPAAESFTLMFLQMWNITGGKTDYSKYTSYHSGCNYSNGYVIPYGDSPLDGDKLGRQVYMDIINRAEKYVYIMTPYLILDSEMETAIKFCAEKGIDVKIILPGVPDRKTPYALARTHYSSLIKSGVKIYEYTPGFVHSKVMVSDDHSAVAGTINLDYRSLYHHFECAVFMYKTACIDDILFDFEHTLLKCQKITVQDVRKTDIRLRLLGAIIKVIAPLL